MVLFSSPGVDKFARNQDYWSKTCYPYIFSICYQMDEIVNAELLENLLLGKNGLSGWYYSDHSDGEYPIVRELTPSKAYPIVRELSLSKDTA